MGMRINTTLPLPAELKAEYPLSKELTEIKKKRDAEIRDIFTGKSDKFVVIVRANVPQTMKIPCVNI